MHLLAARSLWFYVVKLKSSLACKGEALDQALRACMLVLLLKSKILIKIKIVTLLFLLRKNKRSIKTKEAFG